MFLLVVLALSHLWTVPRSTYLATCLSRKEEWLNKYCVTCLAVKSKKKTKVT
jgi:hypothetical protein